MSSLSRGWHWWRQDALLCFGDAVRKLDVKVLLVELRMITQNFGLCSFSGCFDLLIMSGFDGELLIKGRARVGWLEVGVVSGHIRTAEITLDVVAGRASHLVASLAFDESSLA